MTAAADVFVRIVGTDPMIQGLVGGVIIAVLNLPGAVLVLVWRDPSERALDAALGFAAGGMRFVISDEIFPETHSHKCERLTTLGTMLGVVVMVSLDVALG